MSLFKRKNKLLVNQHSNSLGYLNLSFPETAQTTWSPSSTISKLFGKYLNFANFLCIFSLYIIT